MTEHAEQKPETKLESKSKFPFTWKQLVGFVSDVMHLDRKVNELTEKSKKQDETINRMQREMDELAGQIKQLGSFVQTALHDRIDTRAEQAAAKLVSRLIVFQDDPGPPAPSKLPRAKKP